MKRGAQALASARSALGGAAVLAGAALVLALAAPASAAVPGDGSLTQLPAPGGCWSQLATPGCFHANELAHAAGVVVSPDNRTAYVASFDSSSVTGYSLRPNGAIDQRIACWSETLAFGCKKGNGIDGARGLALAPNGKTLYVAAASHTSSQGSVAAFARDPATGALPSERNCENVGGTGACDPAVGLEGAQNVAVANDGATVYVSAFYGGPSAGALTSFPVTATGALGAESSCKTGTIGGAAGCQAGGIVVRPRGLAVPRDNSGEIFFTAYADGGAVASYKLKPDGTLDFPDSCIAETGGGSCPADGYGLTNPTALAVSGNAKYVYVTSEAGGGTVAAFAREAGPGKLKSEIDCIDASGSGSCRRGHALGGGALGLAVGPDGRNAYVGAAAGLSAFSIDPANGALDDEVQCLKPTADVHCGAAPGVATATGLAVRSDNRAVYLAAQMTGAGGAFSAFRRELAPVCTAASRAVASGAAVRLKLACGDANGDPLTHSFTLPAHGSLSKYVRKTATVVYRSAPGYLGKDSFTVRASDGRLESSPATFSLVVRKDAPPRSRIVGLVAKQAATALKAFHGTALDDAALRRVDVAVVRRAKGATTCGRLGKEGKLVAGKCAKRIWLRAKGRAKWRFKLKRQLPKGSYRVFSRATDSAGHRERKFGAKRGNVRAFTLT